MKTLIQQCEPSSRVQPSGPSFQDNGKPSAGRKLPLLFNLMALLAGAVFLLGGAPTARADRSPTNCAGSGLVITLYTSIPDVHIGDRIFYSINVINGIVGSGRIACDASDIVAFIVTPDGVTNYVTLRRTALHNAESDYYPDVVGYTVRAVDIKPDGTVVAQARDIGTIHQNDVNSVGGAFQEVNTQVNEPCVAILAQCVGGVGENGAISFSGTVTNCGNNTLIGVTVTNFHEAGYFTVLFPTNLAIGQVAPFSGSWVPLNPCVPSTATLTVKASDDFTSTPRLVTNIATIVCQNTLTPGIKVTKTCPPLAVAPGQLLTFSGSVSNTGNVTLTNIVVVNDQPAPNTPVLTVVSLAPGAVTNFTGSYLAPTNCSVTDTLTVRAVSRCGFSVTNIASATCPILTAPQIAVTAVCPVAPGLPGGSLTYSGTVRNTGSSILTNVVVVSDRPSANTVVFTVASLVPGASANFTGTYTVPTNVCSVTTTFSGTGLDMCSATTVTNIAVATCAVSTTPAIAVTLACPAVSASTGGLITYSGTVRNAGNVTLNNVYVVNNQPAPNTPVIGPLTLAAGATVNFTTSFTAPANACSVSSTVIAMGNDNCTAALVTNTASATCPLITTPGIAVTQVCPVSPPIPGGVLTYSGTVRNSGNITLTNVVVLNNLSGATPVFTSATLAPGAVANFTGSYLAQTNCSATSISTATGQSICGIAVTNAVSTTCPILTAPQIAIIAVCPATLVVPGGSLTYSGTVRNTGNSSLTNVVIFSDRPIANTVILTVASLAPGAARDFTGTYTVPTNVCSVTTTFSGTGKDLCTAITVTNTAVTTCAVTTTPVIAVTLACPAVSASTGGLITYSGTVRNAGNVTLNNVYVVNNQPAPNTPVIGPLTLAVGATANFTTSFTTPANACSVSSSVTAIGSDNCTAAMVTNIASTTCPLITTPGIAVTQVCPVSPATPGGVLTYSGTVANTGNITLTNVVVLNNLSGATPVFTAATLVPGAVTNFTGSYLAPTNCSVTSIATATGQSICGISVTNAAAVSCPILTVPQIVVTAACPPTPVSPGGLITYSGTVRNTGKLSMTNVVVRSDRPVANTVVLTVAVMAPGASANFTGSYTVPADVCTVTTTFSGTSKDICTGNTVTNTAVTTCAVTTTPAIAVTLACPAVTATAGGLITYSGTVRNAGNVTLNNVYVVNNQPAPNTPVIGPLTLAVGATANFTTTSFTAPAACSVSSTVTAIGSDNCTAIMVTNTASATCPLNTTPGVLLTQLCPVSPAIPGGVLTYSGAVLNTGNVTLTNVVVLNTLRGTTPILTVAILAPGEVTNFTSSYLTPTNCSITSTSTVTARSICGIAVTNKVSTTCPILINPQITVTQTCPVTPVVQGGILTYNVSVKNSGNTTLSNIVVVNNWPAANTVIFTLAKLAPGVTTNFTGSFVVPVNCCVAWSTVEASGQACDGSTVTDTDSGTCVVLTTARIAVTKLCPPTAARPGEVLQYSGIVSNAGNIALVNVTLVSSQPSAGTVIFGPVTLAAGEFARYYASYVVPPDFCGNDTVTASGLNACTYDLVVSSASTTCPISSTPLISVSKLCPALPTPHGSPLVFSGIVSNLGNVTLVNVYVVNNQPTNNTPVIGPITLAPGAFYSFSGSYLAPPVCCSITDTLTARGQDRCLGSNVIATATAICPLLYHPGIAAVQSCPPSPLLMGSVYGFSGYVTNTGDAILTNVLVFTSQVGPKQIFLGPLDLAPGESAPYTGSLSVPYNTCGVTINVTSQEPCKGSWVTNTTTCPVATTPLLAVTQNCPATPATPGSLLTYSGTVRNAGNITLNNIVVTNDQSGNTPIISIATLAPGEFANFTGSYLAPSICSAPSISTATGQSLCGMAVANTASATCPITTTPLLAITQNCPGTPAIPGSLLTYSGTVSNAGNIMLTNVVVLNTLSGATPVFMAATLAPGAVVGFTGSYLVPTNCSVTSSSTVTARSLCGVPVANTVSSTCPITTTPLLAVTQNCPATPATPGSLLTYSGTVRNAGNITLNNIVVTNNQSGSTPILMVATLAPGAVVGFTGSYLAPTNCSATSISTVTAQSLCGIAVTNTASATCPITTSPLLAVTQNCPAIPATPGSLLTYSGTVSNAGNITLNNIVVTNDQSGNTPILSIATLVPGAFANFTGSYIAPAIGPTPSTSTARATSLCGAPVTNTASSACPIFTTPAISVVKLCPPLPVAAGGTLVFSGLIANTGNVTLTNVIVVDSQPAPNTPVLGPITLAPGASTNFTGSYLVPLNACFSADTLRVTGRDANTGIAITNTASANCPILTTPGIAITESCPPGPVSAGSSVAFGGVVSNPGNITLTNVFVISGQPSNVLVLGPITLAPGASAPFAGSYIATGGSSPTTNSTIVTNSGSTITTNVANVIATNTTVTVSTNNVVPTFGTIDPVSGILSNRFNVVSNLHTLMFADQDQNWGPTLFYTTRHPAAGPDQFVTISTIPPFVGVVADRFSLSTTNYDALTLAAPDIGHGAKNFYYVNHDSSSVSTFGVIKAAGASSSADLAPALPGTGYKALAFAAADVSGYGANLLYSLRQTNGIAVLGTVSIAGAMVVTDRYAVGTNANFDSMVFVPGTVSTWGTAIFAYLRHDTNGSIIGTIDPVTHVATDRLSLGTNFLSALTFTATDVGYGLNLFYYLRPERTILTTNSVTTFTTNVVTTFITNAVFTFTTNSVVRFTATNTVTATGLDICQARTVAAAANCLGPVVPVIPPGFPAPMLMPVIGQASVVNGFFSVTLPTKSGKLYTVQYKNNANDPTWINLVTVVGTGGNLPITDTTKTKGDGRFYRVMITP
ncbi:MAG: hypothetical protein WCO56_20110 [Verrucomicrobiota bacterium]